MSEDQAPTATEQTSTDSVLTEEQQDQRADAKVVLIVFTVAVLIAVHFISGFTVDL